MQSRLQTSRRFLNSSVARRFSAKSALSFARRASSARVLLSSSSAARSFSSGFARVFKLSFKLWVEGKTEAGEERCRKSAGHKRLQLRPLGGPAADARHHLAHHRVHVAG